MLELQKVVGRRSFVVAQEQRPKTDDRRRFATENF
jgi:hypothetical protein